MGHYSHPPPPGALKRPRLHSTFVTAVAPTAAPAQVLAGFDPTDVDLQEGRKRFRSDPLDPAQRALYDRLDGINGHVLDWALALDPRLDELLLAVRHDPGGLGAPAWFHRDGRFRDETFSSPFSGRAWDPDTRLVRRLLRHTPYVAALRTEEGVQYAFDLRTVADPKGLERIASPVRQALLPATGDPWSREAWMEAIVCRVPFGGDRFARSTRKRFRLAVPGEGADATVEGVAARILRAHGFQVETPRLVTALYRLLVGEVVAYWFRDPLRLEGPAATSAHPPAANPLEALARGRDAIARIAAGNAPDELRRLGRVLVTTGKRPEAYLRYIERLATVATSVGPDALAGLMDGLVRGHRTTRADLLVSHPGTGQAFLVEVKSTGDRLRTTQTAAALWHQRDGRCGYRLMLVEHPKV